VWDLVARRPTFSEVNGVFQGTRIGSGKCEFAVADFHQSPKEVKIGGLLELGPRARRVASENHLG